MLVRPSPTAAFFTFSPRRECEKKLWFAEKSRAEDGRIWNPPLQGAAAPRHRPTEQKCPVSRRGEHCSSARPQRRHSSRSRRGENVRRNFGLRKNLARKTGGYGIRPYKVRRHQGTALRVSESPPGFHSRPRSRFATPPYTGGKFHSAIGGISPRARRRARLP